MNDTELNFIVILQLNSERPSFGKEPLLSQVRKTYKFGLVFGRATTSVCYPLWTRKNEKRHSSIMMGKIREGNRISFAIMAVCSHLWTWHLSAFHSVNWVFSLLLRWSTFMIHVTPLSLSKNALSSVALCSTSSSSKGSLKFYLCKSKQRLC